MKLSTLLLFMPMLLLAQKKEAIYKNLATTTCECITAKKEINDVNLGICIFDAIDKMSDKDRKAVNIDKDDKMSAVKRIAEQVGIEMAVICPEVFTKIAEDKNKDQIVDSDSAGEADEIDLFFLGTFESTSAKEFNTISLIDEKGVKQECIWLFSFDGDNLFMKNKIVKGDKLEVHYRQQEFFDPKENKYRIYNEITSIKLL